MRWCFACLTILTAIASGAQPLIVTPHARLQTPPVPHSGDAADDPAIWLHPTDPARSLILATDKQGALHVYDTLGRQRQTIGEKSHPNNVDIAYAFILNGRETDLALATTRGPGFVGVKAWTINPDTGQLADATLGPAIPVFDGTTPYGICAYRSPRTAKTYFLVTSHSGRLEQHELLDAGSAQVTARKVRSLKLSSITEGCVADDELGFFYIAQEGVGIWKLPAEPDAAARPTLIAKVGQDGLDADVEGLAIYHASAGKGYLIVSSQGNNRFLLYQREHPNRFILTIDPKPGLIDDVSDTDGIAVTNRPLPPLFPKGLLVVQDGRNTAGNQNFKLYGWEDIATDRLLIDITHDPRPRGSIPPPPVPAESPAFPPPASTHSWPAGSPNR